MNRMLIVSLAAILTVPVPAVTQVKVGDFPHISPAEAEFIAAETAALMRELGKVVLADTLPPDSTMFWQRVWSGLGVLQELIGGLGSRLTPDGIAAWGLPQIDRTAAHSMRIVVSIYITTFDQIARVGPDIFDSQMKAKYRLAVGLLAKMGPDGVNFVTMRE